MRARRNVTAFALSLAMIVPPVVAGATGTTSSRVRAGRRLVAGDTDANAPEGSIQSVAASARGSVLVAWSPSEIRRSVDDGRTFAPVLAGEWRVVSVAVTDDGDVFAVRTRPNGEGHVLASTSRAFTQPPVEPIEVHAAGRYVVVIGRAPNGQHGDDPNLLGRSPDGGRSWSTHAVPSWGNFDNQFRLEPDGVLRHQLGTEAGCGGGYQSLRRLDPSSVERSPRRSEAQRRRRETSSHESEGFPADEWHDETWSFDAPTTAHLGPRGWVYAIDDRCDGDTGGERPCAARGARVVALGDPVEYAAWDAWGVATNGRTTLATLNGRLLRLEGPTAREVARDVPAGFAIATVDARGRALGMLRHRVVRWSPREGWRVIAE